MVRSFRVLKTSCSSLPRKRSSTSFWLILSVPALSIETTIVLLSSSGGGGGVPGGGGCGTAASSPFGVRGVIVMKMTSSTSRISMNGVTLMSAFADTFLIFFFIGCPLLPANLVVQAFGQQRNLIDARIANAVHNLNDIAIFRAQIALEEDRLVQPGGQEIIHLGREVFDVHAVFAEPELSVACYGDEHRVVPIGFFHIDRVSCSGQFDADALLQHWSDNHENDQQNEHDVSHRRNVDVGGNFASTPA